MSNQFWVEPDSLARSGEGYADSEQRLKQLSENAQSLMTDYSSAFGTNNGSEQFRESFEQGMEQHKSEVENRAQTMRQMADGLQMNGRSYAQSEDSADQASQQLLGGVGEQQQLRDDMKPEPAAVPQESAGQMQPQLRLRGRMVEQQAAAAPGVPGQQVQARQQLRDDMPAEQAAVPREPVVAFGKPVLAEARHVVQQAAAAPGVPGQQVQPQQQLRDDMSPEQAAAPNEPAEPPPATGQ